MFGTLGSPHDDARLVYQVTCVGKTREQAGWVADKSMTLLDLFPVVSRSVTFVDVDMPGIIRDDKESPPLFYSTPRFTITSTPA